MGRKVCAELTRQLPWLRVFVERHGDRRVDPAGVRDLIFALGLPLVLLSGGFRVADLLPDTPKQDETRENSAQS